MIRSRAGITAQSRRRADSALSDPARSTRAHAPESSLGMECPGPERRSRAPTTGRLAQSSRSLTRRRSTSVQRLCPGRFGSRDARRALPSLSHSDSALGAFYRRLCSRMDTPSANTATAHKLARMVYFTLTRGEAFVDLGQQRYDEQQRLRSIAALRRRAAALGFEINPSTVAV